MKPTPKLLAVAIALCVASPAMAQTAIDQGDTDGATAAYTLDTIRVREKRFQSPNQNVTVVSAGELEDEQAQNMEDVLRYIPGVTVTDMGRFGDSGFNIRGLEGDRVAIVVDGLALAETTDTAVAYEFFRAGRGAVDVDTLKSVEVIRGADSITAGSGALGGAVLFVTKDPADYLDSSGNDTHVGIKGGYTSSTNEAASTLTFANRTGIVESMLVYTRREGREAESFYDDAVVYKGTARETPDPTERTNTSLLGKLDFVINDANRLRLVYERGRNESWTDNLSRSDYGAYSQRFGDDRSERDRYGLEWFWTGNNLLFDHLEAGINRQETLSHAITRVQAGSGNSGGTPCTVAVPCPRAEDRSTDQTLTRVNFDFDKRFDAGGLDHFLVYGLGWQEQSVDTTFLDWRWNNVGDLVSLTTDSNQQASTDVTSWNLYLRDSVRLIDDRLTLTAGARYDRYEYSPKPDEQFVDNTGSVQDFSFSSATWQLGAEFSITDEHSVWAQAGRGFRSPSVAEMYGSTSTSDVILVATGETVRVPSSVSNPDLASEKSLNIELGYRYQTGSAMWGVSVFRDKYTNFIESEQLIGNPDVAYQTCNNQGVCTTTMGYRYSMPVNRGEVETKGVEVEGRWLIDDNWSARVAASYTEGEKGDGTPLDSIQPASGVLGVNYRADDGRWNVTANLTHTQGKSEDDVSGTVGFGVADSAFVDRANSWSVVDLFGTFNVTDHLRLTAGVYNLFDKEYYQWYRVRTLNDGGFYVQGGVTGNGIHRYSEPGRNYRFTVSYNF